MGLLDNIKNEAKKSGQSKGKFIYFREGEKKRIRFLNDMEDGMEIPFHDSFTKGVNVPCQELFGRDCSYCEDDELRTRNLYAWSVYDYESKEVKIFMQAVNNCTAIPAIMALYENYGTLLERDLVISRTGKGQATTYSVVPMDKNKFRNSKVKPLSKKALLKYLDQAYPADDSDEEDEYEQPKKKKPSTKKSEDWDDEEEDGDDIDYSEMSARELYDLCKERELECKPKKPAKYYINLLEEDDEAHSDWDDEEEDDDEDDWEEDEE